MIPRLLEWTRKMDREGSAHVKRSRWMAMQRLSSIAIASAQPIPNLRLGPMQKPGSHFQITHQFTIIMPILKEVLASPHHCRSTT